MMIDVLRKVVSDESDVLPLDIYYRTAPGRGMIGAEVWLVLSFVLGSIAAGALKAVGADLWAMIKKVVGAALDRRDEIQALSIEVYVQLDKEDSTVLIFDIALFSYSDTNRIIEALEPLIAAFVRGSSDVLTPSIKELAVRIEPAQTHIDAARTGVNLRSRKAG